ncbi:uncharacterized protein LOC124349363 isoform X2 [Daphnia pulicaria]|uniref:uncharacterized protein LOC124349363 isoform X2 n=1 Tax=Daphnia pulicaria TaxID=35523 RepID=UPI001EEBAEF4|nr:uncharacterized protein LOC124349363 isoform X2 [Daphnia pulicaria]
MRLFVEIWMKEMSDQLSQLFADVCGWKGERDKQAKRSTLDTSGGLKQLQRRQRSSSPSFASAQELPEREIVEPRPSEDEMSGGRNGSKIASSLCYQKRRELIALLKVTHPDRHVCYCSFWRTC